MSNCEIYFNFDFTYTLHMGLYVHIYNYDM